MNQRCAFWGQRTAGGYEEAMTAKPHTRNIVTTTVMGRMCFFNVAP
ncbi:hypothetical protein SAMN04489726_4530 [Allokutzneria albata]|uniref:Uncharacterized protein n=1 Tax=Allokutzneria albata TaxID=211114 RepID=A0A1G9Y0X1_ALLAB|nr:hypothetical protein SAMN04489726_4530 [Allokutzneria albata]